MTHQPLLAEAAAGSLEPRHVVVPLRRVLPGARVVKASVTSSPTDQSDRVLLNKNIHIYRGIGTLSTWAAR